MGFVPALGTLKDIRSGILTASVERGASAKILAARYVSHCTLNSGVSGSFAFMGLPLKAFGPGEYDRLMHEVALKRKGPLGGDMKLRGRAAVQFLDTSSTAYQSVQIMVGSLVEFVHNQSEDSGIAQIWDDRWWLGQFTVTGVMVFDPQSRTHYWDMGRQAVYNDLGFPDMLGNYHSPCPKCGYSEAGHNEPDNETLKRSKTWQVKNVVENLRLRFVGNNVSMRNVYTGHRFLPDFLVWPAGLGGNLPGMDRPLKSILLEGMSLLQALQAVIRKAGPYDLYTEPLGDGSYRSLLRILDMGQTRPTLTLSTPDFANATFAQCLSNPLIVSESYIKENIAGYYDEFVLVGDPPTIEIMAEMADTDNNRPADSRTMTGLEPAFLDPGETNYRQSKYFLAFIALVKSLNDDGPSILKAFESFPLMASGYRISLQANPWSGTKYGGKKNAGRMRFMPQNNTGYNQQADNPRDFFPREIVVEAFHDPIHESVPDADPEPPRPDFYWVRLTRYDNLQLSPDATTVLVSALRDGQHTWYTISHHETPTPLAPSASRDFRLRPIRMNVTLQADWPIVAVGKGDPNNDAERVDGTTPTSYVHRAAPGDYVELLRSEKAWPEGLATFNEDLTADTPTQYPERASDKNELFSDVSSGLMQKHATAKQREMRRVEKSGLMRSLQINPGMKPGTCVQLQSKDGLPVIGVLKSAMFSQTGHSMRNKDDRAPDTWAEMGPADWASLQPLGVSSSAPIQHVAKPKEETDMSQDYNAQTGGGSGLTTTAPTTGAPAAAPASKDNYDYGSAVIGPRKQTGGQIGPGGGTFKKTPPAAKAPGYMGAPREQSGGNYKPRESGEEATQRILREARERKEAKTGTPGTPGMESGVKKKGESFEEFQKRHPLNTGPLGEEGIK